MTISLGRARVLSAGFQCCVALEQCVQTSANDAMHTAAHPIPGVMGCPFCSLHGLVALCCAIAWCMWSSPCIAAMRSLAIYCKGARPCVPCRNSHACRLAKSLHCRFVRGAHASARRVCCTVDAHACPKTFPELLIDPCAVRAGRSEPPVRRQLYLPSPSELLCSFDQPCPPAHHKARASCPKVLST